jgi:hypothetical protein
VGSSMSYSRTLFLSNIHCRVVERMGLEIESLGAQFRDDVLLGFIIMVRSTGSAEQHMADDSS